jgi:predicted secreted Zn-dependent protease
MTITLNLVVTLPQHDQLNELSQDIRTNWQRFAARVAAHEQRHVDIYLNGAKTMSGTLLAHQVLHDEVALLGRGARNSRARLERSPLGHG